jgi:hypothetical protein
MLEKVKVEYLMYDFLTSLGISFATEDNGFRFDAILNLAPST